MGRATLELFKGNFIISIKYNILSIPFTIIAITSLIWLIVDLLKKRETFFVYILMDIKIKFKLLIFGLILIDWIANILREI